MRFLIFLLLLVFQVFPFWPRESLYIGFCPSHREDIFTDSSLLCSIFQGPFCTSLRKPCIEYCCYGQIPLPFLRKRWLLRTENVWVLPSLGQPWASQGVLPIGRTKPCGCRPGWSQGYLRAQNAFAGLIWNHTPAWSLYISVHFHFLLVASLDRHADATVINHDLWSLLLSQSVSGMFSRSFCGAGNGISGLTRVRQTLPLSCTPNLCWLLS